MKKYRHNLLFRVMSCFVTLAFTWTVLMPPRQGHAQGVLNLPQPGVRVTTSPSFIPPVLKGLIINPEQPFQFDFVFDSGDSKLTEDEVKKESTRLIKYFLASLTMPEDELWVNLSPYEKDRIIPDEFGRTEMGRDLLAQDYLLKQLTASLIYPEDGLGKKFWDKIYEKANKLYGTSEIPVNTFNKVWIIPDKALIYENGDRAFIVETHMKVMLEEDYLALEQNSLEGSNVEKLSEVSSSIIREVIIPEIEKEVNNGKNFVKLRQIYHSFILAAWYKKNLHQSILSQKYADQKKVVGLETNDKNIKDKIYQQYLNAFEKGVYDFIKEDYNEATQRFVPRKYFSGGVVVNTDGATFQRVRKPELKGGLVLSVGFGDPTNSTSRASSPIGEIQSGHIIFTVHVPPGETKDRSGVITNWKEGLEATVIRANDNNLNPVIVSEIGVFPEMMGLFSKWKESGSLHPDKLKEEAILEILREAYRDGKSNFEQNHRKFMSGEESAEKLKAEPMITSIRDVAQEHKISVLSEADAWDTAKKEERAFQAMINYLIATFYYWPEAKKAWERGNSSEAESLVQKYLVGFTDSAKERDALFTDYLASLHKGDEKVYPIPVRGSGHFFILLKSLEERGLQYEMNDVSESEGFENVSYLDRAAIRFLSNGFDAVSLIFMQRALFQAWMKNYYGMDSELAHELVGVISDKIIESFLANLMNRDRTQPFTHRLVSSINENIFPNIEEQTARTSDFKSMKAFVEAHRGKLGWRELIQNYREKIEDAENVDELEKLVRQIALKSHPDRNPGQENDAENAFGELWKAYKDRKGVLEGTEKRRDLHTEGVAKELWEWEEAMDAWVKANFGSGFRFSSQATASATAQFGQENVQLVQPAIKKLNNQRNRQDLAVREFKSLQVGQVFHFQDWSHLRPGDEVGSAVLGRGSAQRAIVISRENETIDFITLGPPYQDVWATEPALQRGSLSTNDVQSGKKGIAKETQPRSKTKVGIGTKLYFDNFEEQKQLIWKGPFPATVISRIGNTWTFVSPIIIHDDLSAGLNYKTFIPVDMATQKIQNGTLRIVSSYDESATEDIIDNKQLILQAASKLRLAGVPSEFVSEFINQEAWSLIDDQPIRPLWEAIRNMIIGTFGREVNNRDDWVSILFTLKRYEGQLGQNTGVHKHQRSRFTTYHQVIDVPRSRGVVETLRGFLPLLRSGVSVGAQQVSDEFVKTYKTDGFEVKLFGGDNKWAQVSPNQPFAKFYADGQEYELSGGRLSFSNVYAYLENADDGDDGIYVVLPDLTDEDVDGLARDEVDSIFQQASIIQFPGGENSPSVHIMSKFDAQRQGLLVDDDFLLEILEAALRISESSGKEALQNIRAYRQRLDQAISRGDFQSAEFYSLPLNREVDELLVVNGKMMLDSMSPFTVRTLEMALELILPGGEPLLLGFSGGGELSSSPVALAQESKQVESTLSGSNQADDTLGGINFNPDYLNIQSQGNKVEIPSSGNPNEYQNIKINGLVPFIFNITPITNIPMILGESEEQSDEFSLSQLN